MEHTNKIKMKTNTSLLLIAGLLATTAVFAQKQPIAATKDPKMTTYISQLMSKMTIDEKIGQLNLVTGGEATTGSSVSSDVEGKIKRGQVGGIFSLTTPARIRKA